MSQTQSGIYIGVNQLNLNSSEINSEGGIGFDVGLQFVSGIHRSGDLLTEMGISYHNVSLQGDSAFGTDFFKFSVQNFNVNFLYNQYLKIPKGYKPHFGLQAGLSFSILNKWSTAEVDVSNYSFGEAEYSLFDITELSPINMHVVGGLEAGFEQLRLNLRYYHTLTNTLRQGGSSDEDISTSPHIIALSLTYYWDKFY